MTASIVSETGKTYEDAFMVEINYTGGAIAYWCRHAEKFLADEKVRATTLAVIGKQLVVRYEAKNEGEEPNQTERRRRDKAKTQQPNTKTQKNRQEGERTQNKC